MDISLGILLKINYEARNILPSVAIEKKIIFLMTHFVKCGLFKILGITYLNTNIFWNIKPQTAFQPIIFIVIVRQLCFQHVKSITQSWQQFAIDCKFLLRWSSCDWISKCIIWSSANKSVGAAKVLWISFIKIKNPGNPVEREKSHRQDQINYFYGWLLNCKAEIRYYLV